jgi:hypothetical protein
MAINRLNKSGFAAVILYIHTKGLDLGFPNVPEYPRHYYWSLAYTKKKFNFLLKSFRFTSIHEILPRLTEQDSL